MVEECYAQSVEYEWKRLVQDAYHRLEFDTTMFFLKKYLPKKGLILDAGGGPGRYAIELAKKGYDIILLDLVKENLEFAEKRIKKAKVGNKVKEIVQGDIRDLSKFRNSTFDAVLCLGGPLSHIKGNKQRERAVSELIRVARPGAPIFISVFGRFGKLIRGPRYWANKIVNKSFLDKLVNTGENELWKGKYYAHYFTLEEINSVFSKFPEFKLLKLAGLEGLATPYTEEINKLAKNRKAWKNWLEMHYRLCTHPTVAGISVHILIIGKKVRPALKRTSRKQRFL